MGTFSFPMKQPNILDYLKFDVTSFFEGEYKEINTIDTPAIQIVEFEKKLLEKEFDIFDSVRLLVMFDKYIITTDTHINMAFRARKRRLSTEEIKNFTDFLHGRFGTDDAQRKSWSEEDEGAIKDYSFGRIWPTGTGESFISLTYKETVGLEFSILFVNNILESMGKKIEFLH